MTITAATERRHISDGVPTDGLVFTAETISGGTDAINLLATEWIALCEEGASNEPFFRPEWFHALVASFESEILLVTVRKRGKLRMVLPLKKQLTTLHGIPVVKLGAVFNLQSQRFDIIHGADESEKELILVALWDELKRLGKWDVFETRLTRKDSWVADLLNLAAKDGRKTGAWTMDAAPYITFPLANTPDDSIEEYFLQLKKRFRQELKRRYRRLQELGKVEIARTKHYAPALMQKYFELEARSWKGRRGTAASCDLRSEKLHDEFAKAMGALNALDTYELKLDGETIAMSINISLAGKTVFWKTSFDQRFARFSPGNLVIREFLADCCRRGSTELDMLSPASDYKKVWASEQRDHFAFCIFRAGVRGFLFWKWKFHMISRLRELLKGVKNGV